LAQVSVSFDYCIQGGVVVMSNPHAAVAGAPAIKTPGYAWICLIVSLLCAVAIVFAWQYVPGINVVTFQSLSVAASAVNGYTPADFANVMGLVPIGALIMAFPTSLIVRKWGAKLGTLLGMLLAIIGMVIDALTFETNFTMFLAGRFVLGLGLSTAIVSGPTCVSIWFPHSTRGRAMAIWSCWAPIGIFTINAIGAVFLNAFAPLQDGIPTPVPASVTSIIWVMTAILVVIAILFAVLFREPRGEEKSEVSAERKSFKNVLPLFRQRQLWCLFIMFAAFNFMNYAFSTYLKSFLQIPVANGGMGWGPTEAGLIGGAIVACGILAPLGGFILDKTPRHLKFICVVAGICGLTICSAMSFQNSALFIGYVIFFCIGNMFLNGCCRPMVPTFVFKGGATAVALGLSFLTLAQYAGQIPMSYIIHPFDGRYVDPMGAIVPLLVVGVIGVILSFMMKPSKNASANATGGGKPAETSGGGKPAETSGGEKPKEL
jgi:MFS family permease